MPSTQPIKSPRIDAAAFVTTPAVHVGAPRGGRSADLSCKGSAIGLLLLSAAAPLRAMAQATCCGQPLALQTQLQQGAHAALPLQSQQDARATMPLRPRRNLQGGQSLEERPRSALPPLQQIPSLAGIDAVTITVAGPAQETYDDAVNIDEVTSADDLAPIDAPDATETLFGPGGLPRTSDIEVSANLRNHRLLALLTSLAASQPEYIKYMIQPRPLSNGETGYRVLTFGNRRPVWVNVDDTFAVDSADNFISNNRVEAGLRTVLWPAVLQKALAKLFDQFVPDIGDPQDGYVHLQRASTTELVDALLDRDVNRIIVYYVDIDQFFDRLAAVNRGGLAQALTRVEPRSLDPLVAAPGPAEGAAPAAAPLLAPAPGPSEVSVTIAGTQISYTREENRLNGITRLTLGDGQRIAFANADAVAILAVDASRQRVRLRSPLAAGARRLDPQSDLTVEYWLPQIAFEEFYSFVYFIARPNLPIAQLRVGAAAAAVATAPGPAATAGDAPTQGARKGAVPDSWTIFSSLFLALTTGFYRNFPGAG